MMLLGWPSGGRRTAPDNPRSVGAVVPCAALLDALSLRLSPGMLYRPRLCEAPVPRQHAQSGQ